MKIPIQPIHRLNLNQCPECEGEMVLYEKTTSIVSVNNDGIPNTNVLSDDEIDIKYICTNCKRVYDVEKKGMCFGIKRSTRKIIKPKVIKEYNPFYT